MSRLGFDARGRLAVIDGKIIDYLEEKEVDGGESALLHTSKDITFLQQDSKEEDSEVDSDCWSLYEGKKKLSPLIFSNKKSQEDVVREVVAQIKTGKKIILIRGMCGTGKSAIALNIARVIGKAAIVVPIKSLQRQYEEDYTTKKYLRKPDGRKMKIAVITGRENHDSIIQPGVSCADPFLPDTIRFVEKNYDKIKGYYEKNPLIKNKELPNIKKLKRIAIAPANPYWSPIISAKFELSSLKDATKIHYRGLQGKDFIFYHRESGCSYYDQYLAYSVADVIIFNAAKYKIESALDRKPETEIDIIDEADEFLDNFSMQEELSLTRLTSALNLLFPNSEEGRKILEEMQDLVALEEKNKNALGVDERKLHALNDTKLDRLFHLLLLSPEIMNEIELDDTSYANKALEIAMNFKDFLHETYVSFKRYEKDIIATIVSANVSKRFQEMAAKCKTLILMSGTLHDEEVLRDVFGLRDFSIVDAEVKTQGVIEIHRTGKELDCRHANLNSKSGKRKEYLTALQKCLEKAKRPALVHVHSFEDLPTQQEIEQHQINGLMSRETLRETQKQDKKGQTVANFKNKIIPVLFTTKCSRGVDFPGEICNSVIFTKYPNPHPHDPFWEVFKKNYPDYFWEFYKDKARREFLQRIYRAVRSEKDHVYVLSPDIRVLEAVRELQRAGQSL